MPIREKSWVGHCRGSWRRKVHCRLWIWLWFNAVSAGNRLSTIAAATRSNRGVRYCSWVYVNCLRDAQIDISMTEPGDPNENALAERVFRTLKEGFQLGGLTNFDRTHWWQLPKQSKLITARGHTLRWAIRPRGGPCRTRRHKRRGGFELKWYAHKKVRYGNVQYATERQPPP